MLNYNDMKYEEFKKKVIDNMPENPIQDYGKARVLHVSTS